MFLKDLVIMFKGNFFFLSREEILDLVYKL